MHDALHIMSMNRATFLCHVVGEITEIEVLYSEACGLFREVLGRVGMALSAKSFVTSWTTGFGLSQAQKTSFIQTLKSTQLSTLWASELFHQE